jgi:hypothetical protein
VGGHGGVVVVHKELEVTRRASEGRAVPLLVRRGDASGSTPPPGPYGARTEEHLTTTGDVPSGQRR